LLWIGCHKLKIQRKGEQTSKSFSSQGVTFFNFLSSWVGSFFAHAVIVLFLNRYTFKKIIRSAIINTDPCYVWICICYVMFRFIKFCLIIWSDQLEIPVQNKVSRARLTRQASQYTWFTIYAAQRKIDDAVLGSARNGVRVGDNIGEERKEGKETLAPSRQNAWKKEWEVDREEFIEDNL